VKRTRARALPRPHRPIDAGGAGSHSGVRGLRTAQRPANVAHPLALGVPVAAA
jgi:hypothetical protein